jgi:hypothetical protein
VAVTEPEVLAATVVQAASAVQAASEAMQAPEVMAEAVVSIRTTTAEMVSASRSRLAMMGTAVATTAAPETA